MKVSSILRLLTLCLTIEFPLSFSLAAPARSELITKNASFLKGIVSEKNFNPPDTDQPQDSSGAGSRSRVKFCQ